MLMCGNCFEMIQGLDDAYFDPQDYYREDPFCSECLMPGYVSWYEMVSMDEESLDDLEDYEDL